MSGRLACKVAIVTGASSGIGRAISVRYAREGARLVCADMNPNTQYNKSDEETRGTTHERIIESGGQAVFVQVDVSKPEHVENLVEEAVRAYGRLDIMVNNASIGVSDPQPIWDVKPEAWDKMQAVNSKGVFLGIKYASKQMLKQEPYPNGDRGWIINAASINGLMGQTIAADYCAAKGLVVNLTRAAALDCAPRGIRVNAFAPGYTVTSMTLDHFENAERRDMLMHMHPLRGLGRPDDLARVCVFLASDDAQWVTGVGRSHAAFSPSPTLLLTILGDDPRRWQLYCREILVDDRERAGQ
jgi:NAD(P)-dependent dehydrogenase (short-subunit alcohol dehydrogenase family)